MPESVMVDPQGYIRTDSQGYLRIGTDDDPCCCEGPAPYVQLVSCCDSTSFSAVSAQAIAGLGYAPPAAGLVLRIAGACWRSLGIRLTAEQVQSLNLIVWDEFSPGLPLEPVPEGCAAEVCECPEPCCVRHLRCEDYPGVTFPPCVPCDCEPCGAEMLFVLSGSATRRTRDACFSNDSGSNEVTSEYSATVSLVLRLRCEVVDGAEVRSLTVVRDTITWQASNRFEATSGTEPNAPMSWWGDPSRCGSTPTASSLRGVLLAKYIPSGAGSEIQYLFTEECSATFASDDDDTGPVGEETLEYAAACGGGAMVHQGLWHEQFNADCERDRFTLRARWRWVRVSGCEGAGAAARPAGVSGRGETAGRGRGCSGCQDGGL